MYSDEFKNEPDYKKLWKAVKVLLITIGIFLLIVLLGFFIMFLWNNTVTTLFGFPTIGYWQAVGLFLLAKMFFGFGGGSNHSKSDHMKKRFDKKMGEMGIDSPKDFKEYWASEGKEAYKAYVAKHQNTQTAKDSEANRE